LKLLARTERPLVVALNKADRYGDDERERLLDRLREHVRGLVRMEDVVAVSARPAPIKRIRVDANGVEQAELVEEKPDIAALRDRLAAIIEREGRTLAALNAGLFAGRLSDQVSRRIADARRELAAKVIRQYCIAKGIASGLPLIDTRLSKHLAAGTLPGARSIPHTEIGRRLDELDATTDTIVFCNGPQCQATPDAVRILLDAGHPAERLLYYRGGIHDWLTLGLPLETPS